MKSIRMYAYAAILTLSALNFAPSLASAQEAAGSFTLSHEVHWQNTVLPAGKYQFTVAATGPSEILTLRDLSDTGRSFVMRATGIEDFSPSDLSRLLVVSRSGGSFVSAMQLRDLGMTCVSLFRRKAVNWRKPREPQLHVPRVNSSQRKTGSRSTSLLPVFLVAG